MTIPVGTLCLIVLPPGRWCRTEHVGQCATVVGEPKQSPRLISYYPTDRFGAIAAPALKPLAPPGDPDAVRYVEPKRRSDKLHRTKEESDLYRFMAKYAKERMA